MKHPGRKWRGVVGLGAMLVASVLLPANAAEPRWPEGAYNYFVVDQDLHSVLEQFGRHVNVPVRVSGDVPATRLKGKLGAPNPKAFLRWVCDSFRLVWYFDGVTLHVMPQTAQHNAYLNLGPVSLSTFKQRLEAAGIAEERFPIRTTADPQLVSVVGPALYTGLLREMLTSMKDVPVATPDLQVRAPAATPSMAHTVRVPIVPQRAGQTPAAGVANPSRNQPRRIASPRYMRDGASGAASAAAPVNNPQTAQAAPKVQPINPAAPGVQTAAPAQSTGEPTAVQDSGINVRRLSAQEKKRLARELIYEDEAAQRLETGKVLVFRGGY